MLLWQTFVRASRPDGIDLTSYLLSARALSHGASPYLLATPFPYLYPPTLAFLLIPLAIAPPIVAVGVWFALSATAALWSVRRVALFVRPEAARPPEKVAVFLALFFTFFFPIVQSNLRNGQVNFIVLALCVAAALPRSTAPPAPPGPPALPTLPWALAMAIKILPLVLAPYFALRRRWPWMLQAAACGLALLLVPAVVLGERIVDVYRQYREVMFASSLRVDAFDFSLAGTISALTRTAATPALRISAAAVVLGWVLQADGRRLRHEFVRPLALYLLAIPLASPKSEVHHLAFALPAAAIAAAECRWPSRYRDRTFMIAAPAAAALFATAMISPYASGPIYCAALIGAGVAVVKSPPAEAVR